MKKKLIGSFLTLAMLLQAFAFMPAIAAETESEPIINFSFEEESAQTAKFESLLKNVSNGAYTAVDSSKINYLKNSAYGIGRYLKNTQTMWAIKLEEPIDRTNGKYINKALTVEYDFMPLKTPDSSLNPASGGAGSVVLAALNTETGKYANFSGLEFNNTGNIYKFWARNPSLGSFEPNKWYRCKFVMILNENGSVKHENNFTYYINGEKLATGKDYTASSAKPEEISYAADEAYMTGETLEFAPNGSGIADLMIFDRALSYPERLMLYNGFNQTGYYSNRIPE